MKSILILAIALVLAIPETADAYDIEYITYGGYDIHKAFQRAALIFSDVSYVGLAAGACLMVMVIGSSAAYIEQFLSGQGKGGFASWAVPVLVGVMLFSGLVIPKGTITVRDEISNQDIIVGGVPDIITLIAGIFNKLEVAMIKMAVTAADPIPYDQYPGKTGFKILQAIGGGRMTANDTLLDYSLKNYINDCVWLELALPDTTLDINVIKTGTSDFRTEFAKAANPGAPVTYYSSTYKGGTSITCQEAWTNINADLSNTANFSKAKQRACVTAGFDANDPVDMTRCSAIATKFVSTAIEPAANFDTLIRQAAIAQRLEDAAMDGNTVRIGNYNSGQTYMGEGQMAQEWLPIMRSVITSIGISLTPFLMLFLPTIAFRKVLSAIIFLFLFPAVWGLVDAIISTSMVDHGIRVFQSVSANKLGFDAFLFMEDSASKTLAAWYKAQSLIPLLAMGITGMFVAGGYSFSSMASGLSGSVASQGADAQKKTATADGLASMTTGARNSIGDIRTSTEHSFDNQSSARSYGQSMDAFANLDKMSVYDTQEMGSMSAKGSIMNANETMGKWGAGGSDSGKAYMGGAVPFHRGQADVNTLNKAAENHGRSVQDEANLQKGASVNSIDNVEFKDRDGNMLLATQGQVSESYMKDGNVMGHFNGRLKNAEEQEGFAKYLDSQGHSNAAETLRGMKPTGSEGISLDGDFYKGEDGRMQFSNLKASHGTQTSHLDTGKKEAYSSVNTQDQDISGKKFDTGIHVGNALQTMSDEKSMAKILSGFSGLNTEERNAALWNLSKQGANEYSSLMDIKGFDSVRSTAKLTGGIGVDSKESLPGFIANKVTGASIKGNAEAGVDVASAEDERRNLVAAEMYKKLSGSYEEGFQSGLKGNEVDGHVAKEFSSFMNSKLQNLNEPATELYGAKALGQPFQEMRNMIGSAGDKLSGIMNKGDSDVAQTGIPESYAEIIGTDNKSGTANIPVSASLSSQQSRRDRLEEINRQTANTISGMHETNVQNVDTGSGRRGSPDENRVIDRVGKKISDLLEEQGKNEEMNKLLDGSMEPKNKDGGSSGPDNVEGMNRNRNS
ncbi:MAG: conjugal transfer protein TraG N-terminal domain-containing protein [Nitrospinota bacterium]|nr:conjugal transfer protein TraG N-terminal domain-containing protein [Nitrospinota bacterium]